MMLRAPRHWLGHQLWGNDEVEGNGQGRTAVRPWCLDVDVAVVEIE